MSKVIRFCVRCKADRDVDGISFRCLTCGTLTKHLTAADAAVAPPTPEPSATVTLPSNQASRRWMEQTRALAEGFRRDATEARARAAEASAKAVRLETDAAAYEGLLKQVALDEQSAEAMAGQRAGRWSRNYDACIDCGKTDVKHAAQGRCGTCHSRYLTAQKRSNAA